MDEPEDLLQLVLGMTLPEIFREIFAEADGVSAERFDNRWDVKTVRIGGKDSVQAVRDLVGNAAQFEYQDASNELPRVGLPALEPFFRTVLALNGRQVRDEDDGMSFKTPDAWRQLVCVRSEYSGLHFDRQVKGKEAIDRIAGIGHKAVDMALNDAIGSDACLASIPVAALPALLFVFSVADSVTTGGAFVRTTIFGVEGGDRPKVLRDWELLERINLVAEARGFRQATSSLPAAAPDRFASAAADAGRPLERELPSLQLSYAMPGSTLLAAPWSLREPATG